MKKLETILFLVLVTFVTHQTLAVTNLVTKAESSAFGTGHLPEIRQPHPLDLSGAIMTVTPVLLPVKSSPNWAEAAQNVITDALNQNLSLRLSVDQPTQYQQAFYHLGWSNVVMSLNNPMWQGRLSPTPQFTSEHGQVMWALIDVRSSSRLDDISLDQLIVTITSTDGLLNDTLGFAGGVTYTLQAPLILANGAQITSGSTSQKGNRFLILVCSKLFNTGDTQAGLNEVRDWVTGQSNYSLNYLATYAGSTSQATVSAEGLNKPLTPKPLLTIDNQSVSIVNPTSGRSYVLEGSSDMLTWTPRAILDTSWPKFFISTTSPEQFFRVKIQ